MNSNQNKISALIITYNEINHIEEVIANVSFADEIIIVDSYSDDGTYEKLQELKHTKVIQRKFENFTDQRNFAIGLAQYKWVLFIDADERITPNLKQEIISKVNSNTETVAFKFHRQSIFQEKHIRFSGLQTDRIYRLFKKGYATYKSGKLVHEIPIINGKSETLNHKMLHYSFSNYDAYKIKIESYAKLRALELFNAGLKPNFFHFYIKPFYRYTYNYLIRLGFLDGKIGHSICKVNAYGVSYRYKELKRLIDSSK